MPRSRRASRAIAVGVVGAVLVAMVIAAQESVPRRTVSAPVAWPQTEPTLSECRPIGIVRTVDDLNRVAATTTGTSAFEAGDVGVDVRLQDGRRLWLFGDTLRHAADGSPTWVRNSMLVQSLDCIAALIPVSGGAVIPDRPGSGPRPVGYWPMSVGRVARDGFDLVAVGAQRVRSTGDGPFDFETLGSSIAVFRVPFGGLPELVLLRDISPDDPDPSQPMWGAAAAVDGDWVYVYATSGEAGAFGRAVSVARVRIGDLADRSAWRVWDGRHWTASLPSAAQVIPAQGGVSQTFSVFEQDGIWYALSKRDDFLGTDLVAWTAPSAIGPFRPSAPLAGLPSDLATGSLRYMPLAHPDLLPLPGTVVVSYSRNDTDITDVIADPTRYRPAFLRVTLPAPPVAVRE